MRFFRILTSVLCLLAAASAAEIKIRVIDPQSAVVAGAQVVLIPEGSTCSGPYGRERRLESSRSPSPSGNASHCFPAQ